ncbi:MAG: RNA polymerase sigma factor [Bacteroidales bacterium]|jgi:RNA polymerase sigma-70 factor (ECF subfamily)|nr:RNA polymerase sigma factor [Bacteroidales bacterium]
MDTKSDRYYIGQVLAGSMNAFSRLVDIHKDKAFNLAFRICGNREEAEEIAQDAFMKAYRSLKDFRMKSSFATWLYRIVYNTAVSLVRSRKKNMLSLDEFPADAIDFISAGKNEEESMLEYRNSLVNFALQNISEEDRGLITLFYYEELEAGEISRITGISRNNIKVRLFRARQKMAGIIRKAEMKNIYSNDQSGIK